MDLKSLLNKEQYEAATTIEGQVLILAGAGSGKTRVLTHRMAYMIGDKGIRSYNILAITFTNKAAAEMKERVKVLIGDEADSMWISTFHSTCVRILRREIDKMGYKKDFTIYDSSDQKTLMKHIIKELNINDKEIADMEILSAIGKAKDKLQSATQYKRENEGDFRKNKIADAYILYQKKLKQNNALDFDDLIVKTVELFKTVPEVLEFYQNKFKYIMVDEYQDTNKAQYEFIRLMAGKNENICVVGDDDQCIYQWRGADIRNILDFEKDYPKAKVVKLEQNYRSKGNILESANKVIANNTERKSKVLRTDQTSGEKIRVYRAYSDTDEGTFVSSEIKRVSESDGLSYKDFAVLYRTNAQSRIFEEVFRRNNIPYRIIGGLKFYDRKEIKDILAYLRVIQNPVDTINLRRIVNVPKRNIGDATVEKVQTYANEVEDTLYNSLLDSESIPTLTVRNKASIQKFTELMEDFIMVAEKLSVSELIEHILDKTGYMKLLKESKDIEDESRIENLKELVSDAVDFEKNNPEEKTLWDYLEKVALVQDVDNMDQEAESVVMMTVHSSKGLEFPVVFMVGMENGMFPGSSSFEKDSEMQESRRLCYVGITRAREKLYMTSAEVRRVFGRTVSYPQSDFIAEIPPDLKEYVNARPTKAKTTQNMFAKNLGATANPHSLRTSMGMGYGAPSNAKKETAADALAKLKDIMDDGEVKKLTAEEATIGRKVKHVKFGVGTIIKVNKESNDVKLMIAFDNQGIKNLMLSFAPLEMV